MPVIARGADDLLLDGMLAKLEAFRVREVALSAGADFVLARDRSQPYKDLSKPIINLEIESDEPEDKASGFTASIKAYCFAPATADDAVGASRLYYLKEQVRVGLLAFTTPDLGQTLGTVKLGKPSWARIHFQDRETEQNILAGAWTFPCTYASEPEDIATPDLTDLVVSVGPTTALALWSAAYHYGGTP